jgi:histidinol-phosphate aminotransferase
MRSFVMNDRLGIERCDDASEVRPVDALIGAVPYAPGSREGIDLLLDSNEGVAPPRAMLDVLRDINPDGVRRYPSKDEIESLIASRLGIASDQVLVTAGGDEAIDRVCRAYLDRDRALVQHSPTFEMIARSAQLTGATVRSVPWMTGPLPRIDMIDAAMQQRGVIALVSPNNPTGAPIEADDLRTICEANPRSVVLLDLAYTEFADVDLTPIALGLPNVIATRTLSKAYGLAGLRVGYAVGPASLIAPLRAVGGPYPISMLSLIVAHAVLNGDDKRILSTIEQIRHERDELATVLQSLGADALPSQANFILCRVGSADRVDSALRARGIAVRRFANDSSLANCLRITLPGCEFDFQRLVTALKEVARESPADFAARQTA